MVHETGRVEFGIALWTMQSTAAAPASQVVNYRRLRDDARLVEDLGFDSLWFAEHRFWYDGWCPSPLVAAASVLAVTRRLRVGTAMLLLPQHDPDRLAACVATLDDLGRGRLELGVGLGHRDPEFDGLGLSRSDRGRRMSAALDALPDTRLARTWVGGIADAALRRAVRAGANILLPQTLHEHELRAVIGKLHQYAAEFGRPLGRIGMQQDVWVDDTDDRARRDFLPKLVSHYREEAGAWWIMKGRAHGLERPADLDRQITRIVDTAAVGAPDRVAAKLGGLVRAGVEAVIVRLHFDVTRDRWRHALKSLATEVVPAVRRIAG